MMQPLRALLLAAGLVGTAVAQEPPPPGTDAGALGDETEEGIAPVAAAESADLIDEWNDLAALALSEDARWADNTIMKDGVCSAKLTKGILVPVTSGRRVAEERAVGAAFFGEGVLEVAFPEKEDAIAFANHMFTSGEMTREELRPIVEDGEPYRTSFDRAILFTADRQMDQLLRTLDPVGGGMKERTDTLMEQEASDRGVDAEYVVTGSRGRLKAALFSRNLLPDRRRALAKSGMDPAEALRFDRMVHDRFNVPWKQLRMIMEFRSTDHSYHPEHAGRGAVQMAPAASKWLSCFRDGTDHRDFGLRSMAFAHAVDNNNFRYLKRFSGERFFPNEDGEPLPPARIDPVEADVDVEVKLIRRVDIESKVRSRFTIRAREDGVQHVVLRTPRHEALWNHWTIERLGVVEGEDPMSAAVADLDWMGLDANRADRFTVGNLNDWQATGNTGVGAAGDTTASGSVEAMGLGGSTSSGPSTSSDITDGNWQDIFNSLDNTSRQSSFDLAQKMEPPQELLVALPRPLAEGEEVTIALDWTARWPFANWGVIQGAEANQYRSLGVTTGPRSFLPELLPMKGGTVWDFTIDVTAPPRRLDLVISGDTTGDQVDEGGWLTVTSVGRDARTPALVVGRYLYLDEPPSMGMPGVKVHLQKGYSAELAGFPPEVRRVLTFMRRFMPLPEARELEVYQGKTYVPRTFLTQPRDLAPAGMVGINTIKVGDKVTEAGTVNNVESMDGSMLARQMLAQQVVSQVWGQKLIPASDRDAWVAEALTEAFGYFYLRAAMKEDGFAAFEDTLEQIRVRIETGDENFNNRGTTNKRRPNLSLTDGGSFALNMPTLYRDYSFYVLARMLRERLGDQAFFRGIDMLGRRNEGRRINTVQLREAFEQASGEDLTDFFAYWVRGGYVPNITAEYRHEPQPDGKVTVHACVVTDIPFGQFDLPIAVGEGLDKKPPKNAKKAQEARRQLPEDAVGGMVEVIDGRASFSVPDMGPEATVQADPFGLVLAYARKSKKVDKTTCDEEGRLKSTYEASDLEAPTDAGAPE